MVSKRQIQELKRKCTYGFCALLFYYIGFRSEFNRIFRNQNIIKLKHQKYKENSENISSLRSSAISTKCSKNHLFCVRHKEYEIKTNFHIMNKLSVPHLSALDFCKIPHWNIEFNKLDDGLEKIKLNKLDFCKNQVQIVMAYLQLLFLSFSFFLFNEWYSWSP